MAKLDPQTSSSRGATRSALVVIGVLALAGLAYAIARVDILRARIVIQQINLEAMQSDNLALRSRIEGLAISNQNSVAQLGQLRNELTTLSDNFGALHNRAERAQRVSERSEALYLLRLANNQLRLAHDLDGATHTLTAAESILRDTGDSAVVNIHQQVLARLAELRALPHGDVTRIQQQLLVAEQQVDSLPLAGMATSADTELTSVGFARAWAVLKRGLASLFVVRKTAADVGNLLSADEQGMRRRHLQLLLLGANQATHLHDQDGYIAALNDSRQWLDQSFDPADATVSRLRAQLETLAQQNIAPTLPDLTPTIEALARVGSDARASSP